MGPRVRHDLNSGVNRLERVTGIEPVLARLAGFEPATGCLEGTASEAGTVCDVCVCVRPVRRGSLRAGAVATGCGYSGTVDRR
jgi:hypothetical protein